MKEDIFAKKQNKVTIKEYGLIYWYFYTLRHNTLYYLINTIILSSITSYFTAKYLVPLLMPLLTQ